MKRICYAEKYDKVLDMTFKEVCSIKITDELEVAYDSTLATTRRVSRNDLNWSSKFGFFYLKEQHGKKPRINTKNSGA